MRIIKRAKLEEFWLRHPDSESSLRRWYDLTKAAEWQTFIKVKETFPAADSVIIRSGKACIVFDIAGNHYRMIAAIHYKTHIVYVLKILTHKEYDIGKWRNEL